MVATDDGAVLWTADQGHGPPFVLCHGGPGLWDYLEPVGTLVDDIVRVIRWDQRGCGRSSGYDRPYSVARSVADLDCIRLELGVDRWIVGGHSWGASLALAYALAHPTHTRAVVYVSGVGIGQAWNAAYHAESDRRRGPAARDRLAVLRSRPRTSDEEHELRMLTWSSDFVDPERALDMAASIDAPFSINTDANHTISAEMKTWDEDAMARACAALDCPALILHGELDPRPAWAIDSLVAALPNAELVVMPGVGHLPWLEAPEAFRSHLRDFLARLP